jgi:hypothetical protein
MNALQMKFLLNMQSSKTSFRRWTRINFLSMILKITLSRRCLIVNHFLIRFTICLLQNWKSWKRTLTNIWRKNSSSNSCRLRMFSYSFVKKSNDKLRLCVNYRELNEITIKNRYLLFLINETLNKLFEAKIFSKLNVWDIFIVFA